MSYEFLQAIAEGAIDPSALDETTLRELKSDYDHGRAKGYSRKDALMYGMTIGFVRDDFASKQKLKDADKRHQVADKAREKADKMAEKQRAKEEKIAAKAAKRYTKKMNKNEACTYAELRAISEGATVTDEPEELDEKSNNRQIAQEYLKHGKPTAKSSYYETQKISREVRNSFSGSPASQDQVVQGRAAVADAWAKGTAKRLGKHWNKVRGESCTFAELRSIAESTDESQFDEPN